MNEGINPLKTDTDKEKVLISKTWTQRQKLNFNQVQCDKLRFSPCALRLSVRYFSHITTAVFLVQDFSLELKPGQMTALVGPSGEGKSTCVSLLERFYEPQGGEILLDNKPLKSYDHRFLHEKVVIHYWKKLAESTKHLSSRAQKYQYFQLTVKTIKHQMKLEWGSVGHVPRDRFCLKFNQAAPNYTHMNYSLVKQWNVNKRPIVQFLSGSALRYICFFLGQCSILLPSCRKIRQVIFA